MRGSGSSNGMILAAAMKLVYNLALLNAIKIGKKHEENGNHLSVENPGDSLARPAASAVRELSARPGRGHRAGTGGSRPVGTAGPERTASGPVGNPTARRQTPGTQKPTRQTIITSDFPESPQNQPVIFPSRRDLSRVNIGSHPLGRALYRPENF